MSHLSTRDTPYSPLHHPLSPDRFRALSSAGLPAHDVVRAGVAAAVTAGMGISLPEALAAVSGQIRVGMGDIWPDAFPTCMELMTGNRTGLD